MLEDNDGSHGTRSDDNECKRFKDWMAEHFGFKWFANVPQSPDLNIIENVWRLLKQRVKARHVWKTKQQLRTAIEKEWARITPDEINKLVDSMPKRMEQCWVRGGLHTEF